LCRLVLLENILNVHPYEALVWELQILLFIYGKNDFAEVSTNLAVDLKIIWWIIKIIEHIEHIIM